MDDREPTIRSRTIGEGLRRAMGTANYNGREMAHQLGWSQARVSRLLSGKRGGTPVDVSAFLAVCRVHGAERDRLLALAAQQDEPGWFQQHAPRLPAQLLTLVQHEDLAVSISQFEATLVPGLLQTADYARALLRESGRFPADEVENRVTARLARTALLGRGLPERFVFFVHEFALRLAIGGAVVMTDQLHHLLRLSVRPRLALRVVPAALGAHPAIAGPFRLMEFPEFRPVVYLESETTAAFLEEPVEIDTYREILDQLADVALDPGHSREMITTLAIEYAALADHPAPGSTEERE